MILHVIHCVWLALGMCVGILSILITASCLFMLRHFFFFVLCVLIRSTLCSRFGKLKHRALLDSVKAVDLENKVHGKCVEKSGKLKVSATDLVAPFSV